MLGIAALTTTDIGRPCGPRLQLFLQRFLRRFLRRSAHIGVLLALLGGLFVAANASPSIFPEDAAFLNVGYNNGVAVDGGLELVLPVEFVDVSVGAELYAPLRDFSDDWTVRLSGSGLVFPAFNVAASLPPLGLGLGTDVNYGADGFSAHIGPMFGTDLLFSFDLPITVSAYIGLGFSEDPGLSLAWAGQIRYYFDDITDNLAVELSSTDLLPISLGVRYLF